MSQRLAAEKKSQLISLGLRIDKGDPAYQIWEMFSYDEATRHLYNQSLAMILAQQFYLEEKGNSVVDVDALFATVQQSVPAVDRCPTQPKCDPNQR